MPTLTLTRRTARRVEVLVEADDGTPTLSRALDPLSDAAQKLIGKESGLDRVGVLRLLAQVEGVGSSVTQDVAARFTACAAPAAPLPFSLTLRGIYQRRAEGVEFPGEPAAAVRAALEVADYPHPEPVLQWDDLDALAVTDVDYHTLPFDQRPEPWWLENVATALRPTPLAAHGSHGNGVKLFYAARDGFTARELAAVAAVEWLRRDGRATAEVKKESRHPLYARGDQTCGRVLWLSPSADVSTLARWFAREADPDAVEEYLGERGWVMGQKLPHSECPIAPGVESHGEPVLVGEAGVYCHKCAAAGHVAQRASKPGWLPWTAVVGALEPTIFRLVKNRCHWEHARIVLADRLRLPEPMLRDAYRAALKLVHGCGDPRLPGVFTAGSRLVRVRGAWQTVEGEPWNNAVTETLAKLPAARYVTEEGDERPDPTAVEALKQTHDLSERGYPHVERVTGIRIYGQHLDYPDDRISFAVAHADFRSLSGRLAPRYRPAAARMALGDAWREVESVFPGINRNYLRLLIAAKGCVEGRTSQCPFIAVAGPSSSAKSTTVQVAAGLCGDHATEVTWTRDTERLRQGLSEGVRAGSFVAVNEVFKEADRAKVSYRAALDPFLNVTEDSTSHELYVGSVPLGKLPVLVVTDVNVPREVASDTQIARRFIHVRLDARVDWEPRILAAGIGGRPSRFRLRDETAAAAADAIVSDVIDQFFKVPRTLESIAKELGFSTLEKSGEADDPDEQLRLFFKLVCAAPELSGSDAARYSPGQGWKAIRREDSSPLAELWGDICDGQDGAKWTASRRCDERDWGNLLGAPHPVRCELRSYKSSVLYVRFRSGGTVKRPERLNGDCVAAGGEAGGGAAPGV